MVLLISSAVFEHLTADKALLGAVGIFHDAVQSNSRALIEAVCVFTVSNDALSHKAGLLIEEIILAFNSRKA